MNEMPIGSSSAGHPYLVCYRDPFCTQFNPIRSHDAFVFSANDTRTLIEVGARSVIFDSARQDDGALLVRVAQLDRDGLPFDGASPLGCHAGGCTSLPDIQSVTATGTFPTAFSDLTPTAVFSLTSATAKSVEITTCQPDVLYPATASLSAFYGGFPAAHAYYGGDVGTTGDANAPGTLNATAVWGSTGCTSLHVYVGAGATVWVVAGSPGASRGTRMVGGVTFTFSDALAGSTHPLASPTSASGACAGWGGTVFAAVAGRPNVYSSGSKWLRYSAAAKAWGVFSAAVDASATSTGGTSCTIAGTFNRTSLNATVVGVCPVGAYRTALGCVACPLASHVSPQGVVSSRTDGVYASTWTQCFCPYGWQDSVDKTRCAGPHVGGPLATEVVSTFCPTNLFFNKVGCAACPVGTSGATCADMPEYSVIEIVAVGGRPGASFAGLFKRMNVTQNGRSSYQGRAPANSKWFWVYHGGGAWRVETIPTVGGYSDSSPVTTSLAHNVTASSIAFCDGGGASTVDFAARRICYCGEGYFRGVDSRCYACPAGTFRGIGGANSTIEKCWACGEGRVSPSGAAACAAACPAGTTLRAGARCEPVVPPTCAVGSAPAAYGGGACVACDSQFACDGTSVRVCPHHTVADAAGASCVCPAGYTSALGVCAPPQDVALTSRSLSLSLSLARMQYVAFRVPMAETVRGGGSPGALVWRASPVYATTTAPFATLYHAWGGAWGLDAPTALTPATFSRAGPGFGAAGTAWALDSTATAAVVTNAAAAAAGAVTLAGQRPTASFGAVAHALDVLPLAAAGVHEWFTFDFSQLRSFPADATVSLSAASTGAAGAAATAVAVPRLAVAVDTLGALFSAGNGVARVAFNGSVGAGDRVALVPVTMPCSRVVDPGAPTGDQVFAMDISIVSLDADVSALLRVPPSSGGNARAICVAMSAAAWNLTSPPGAAPFVAVFGAGSQVATFAANTATPPPAPVAAGNSMVIAVAVVCSLLAVAACATCAFILVRRRRQRAAREKKTAAAGAADAAGGVHYVENPIRQRRFRRVVDPDDGAVFFECVETGESSWSLPPDAALVGDGDTDGDAAPPPRRARSFRRIVDDTDGAVFYEDCESGDALWTLPEEAVVIDDGRDGRDGGGRGDGEGGHVLQHDALSEPYARRRFFRVVDETDGAIFFVDCDTEDTLWTLPEGAVLVDAE